MKNKPVAWMVDGVLFTSLGAALNISFDIKQPCIPLYTHPANPYQSITDTKIEPTVVSYTHPVTEHFEDEPQAEELHEIMQSNAELTDEEIIDIKTLMEINYGCVPPLEFARAILRKAREK